MNKIYPPKVYLNGDILAPDEAKISVFDRGFLFGDGIYEVMAQIGGQFLYQEAHIDRLQEGLQKIKIDFDVRLLDTEIPKLLDAAELHGKDCLLYIQITRGVAPRKHAYPNQITPTILMYATAQTLPDINDVLAQVVSMNDFRWSRCDIKMTSLLGNVMANEYGAQKGCYETVLFREGLVTEASHSNVFFVRDRVVYTHPENEYILSGITRKIVLELCAQLGIKVMEEAIAIEEVVKMDEAFLTGTNTQIASIKQWDDHFFYHGDTIGGVTKELQWAFKELKERNSTLK